MRDTYQKQPVSRHEREEHERPKEHQMYCPLHDVRATGSESNGARKERHRKHRHVLGLQAQDEGQSKAVDASTTTGTVRPMDASAEPIARFMLF